MSTESTFGTSDNTRSPRDRWEHPPLIDTSAHRRNLQAAQNALIEEFHTLIGDTERLLKPHAGNCRWPDRRAAQQDQREHRQGA